MGNPLYVRVRTKDGLTYRHVLIAEAALGKPLPPGAQVHHVDGNPRNNVPANLVICQDQQYHYLLHQRTNDIRQGLNPNNRHNPPRKPRKKGMDRTPKPGTAIYLLRDVPRTDLKAAKAALQAAGEGRTIKDVLLTAIHKLAASERRKAKKEPESGKAYVAAPRTR